MDNMKIYTMGREVPDEAKKSIQAGRLKGMTDINPMWRIYKLTEIFGPCGIGWKYTITRREMVPGANNEISCFVDIDLFYKWEGEWSEAVPGTGGASYVAKERNGMYTSDECYKMALTDALSVACKALGIGADVYWAAGRSKYTGTPPGHGAPGTKEPPCYCEDCTKEIRALRKKDNTVIPPAEFATWTKETYGRQLCLDCQRKAASEP